MESKIKIIPPSRTALALAGGGTQAVFEVGAAGIFEKYKIPVDVVIGVSAGSIIGASLVSENFSTKSQLKEWLSFKKRSDIFERRLRPGSIYSLEKLEKIISRIDFKKLMAHPTTFIATATEVPDDDTIFFSSKDLEIIANHEIMKQGILASSAIGGVFPSVQVKINGKIRELIDGAAKRPLPLKKLVKLGCNTIVVMRCRSSKIKKPYPKTIFRRWAYERSLSINNAEKDEINFMREHTLGFNLFVIEPDWLPETLTPYSWSKGDFERALKHGAEVAERELKPLLEYYGA